jgi:hypothetical protein
MSDHQFKPNVSSYKDRYYPLHEIIGDVEIATPNGALKARIMLPLGGQGILVVVDTEGEKVGFYYSAEDCARDAVHRFMGGERPANDSKVGKEATK